MKWKGKLKPGLLAVSIMLILVTGCSKSLDHTVTTESQTIEMTAQTEMEQDSETQASEIQSAQTQTEQLLEVIRAHMNGTLTQNHTLDDSFYQWFGSSFGQPVLQKIAEGVQTENTDPKLWYEATGSTIQVLWSKYCQDNGKMDDTGGPVIWKEASVPEETVIDLTGDVNFAENYSTTRFLDGQKNGISSCFSADLLAEMKSADILVMNNEFTISKRGEPIPGKKYTFRADPSRTAIYKELGTDLVSLANNHAYDYGPEALSDTLDVLDQAEIAHVGAGKDLNQAKTPVSYIINGRKITFVAATQIEKSTNYTKEATDTSPGVLKTLKPDQLCTVIRKADANSDYVVVLVHWGTEGKSSFDADQMALAKAYQQAGADAVIGSHPHCLQGAAYVEQMPILFSLGNFWFNGKTMDTALAQIKIRADGSFSIGVIPCKQSGLRTTTVTEESAKGQILKNLNEYSDHAQFDSDGILQKKS